MSAHATRTAALLPGLVAALGLALAMAGCRSEPYCLNCVDGGMPTADVRVDTPDAPVDVVHETGTDAVDVRPDVLPDGCTPGAIEICNHFDDNCDGVIDEGIDTQTDPRNCGGCGMSCNRPHAFPSCQAGTCVIAATGCDIGFYNLDMNPDNGCEYACALVPGATNDATCNRRDDNCNGRVDEDVDLCADPLNCGSCGRSCSLVHAVARCARTGTGDCTDANTRCEVASCAAGFSDLDADPANGCEYECIPTGPETCDGRDNDCNGTIDEGDPGGGAACGSNVGACTRGVEHCRTGSVVCEGDTRPAPETCNAIDDDCDGMVDNGTLAADTRIGLTCGSGIGDCRPGTQRCVVGVPTCTGATVAQPETCDGRDNDCNGMIDDGVPPGAACGSSVGACRPGTLQCAGGALRCQGGTLPTPETCNAIDDDCNGAVDDGTLATDPRIGASCGSSTGDCTAGIQRCVSGAPVCTGGTGPTAETCDGRDNDCNGTIDDGVPPGASCGSSVGACRPGTLQCVGGAMACRSAVGPTPETCNAIDDDCNGAVDDGALAADPRIGVTCGSGVGDCRPGTQRCVAGVPTCSGGTGPGTETCDGRDNDCNGTIDDGVPSAGPCGSSVGTCVAGTLQCVAAAMRCQGSTGPAAETCNGLDDDCNGVVDNGFDLTRDVNNCGACGTVCGTRPHAFIGCVSSACGLLACEPGFVNLDGSLANGCEYACVFRSATEICNGLDDNCNGTSDEGVVAPAGFCRSGGACGSPAPTPSCMGASGWRCAYPATVDVNPATGQPAAAEVRCDGIDNNCNGAIDEPFTNLGTVCRVGPAGTACLNSGTYVCRADLLGTVCSVTTPLPATPERCDGIDNDCDNAVDEGALAPGTNPSFVPVDWARVQPTRTCGIIPGSNGAQARCTGSANCDAANTLQCLAGFWCDATVATPAGSVPARSAVCNPPFWMMTYEASAPNATAVLRGDTLFSTAPLVVNRACSTAGVVPWTNVTPVDATAACARFGATLCTEGQWQSACEVRTTAATTNCVFGYETTCTVYGGTRCNGLDFDFIAGGVDDDGLLITGSPRVAQCDAAWTGFAGALNIHDMSGNAREITGVRVGLTDAYPVRGGSYTSPSQGLRCDSSWTLVDGTFFYPNTGFRCCATGAVAP